MKKYHFVAALLGLTIVGDLEITAEVLVFRIFVSILGRDTLDVFLLSAIFYAALLDYTALGFHGSHRLNRKKAFLETLGAAFVLVGVTFLTSLSTLADTYLTNLEFLGNEICLFIPVFSSISKGSGFALFLSIAVKSILKLFSFAAV